MKFLQDEYARDGEGRKQRLDRHLHEDTTIVETDLDRGRSSTVPYIVSQASDVVEEIPDAFLH